MVAFLGVMAVVSVAVVAVQLSCLCGYESSKDAAPQNDQVDTAQQLFAA